MTRDDAEIAANAACFDCTTCAHLAREYDLWPRNRRAMETYRRLCGRTTADLGLAGWLFQALTDGWSTTDVVDLVKRLEVIRDILDPPKRPTASRTA